MVRFLSVLPLALALSAPAIAGPTVSNQGPGDGGAPVSGVRSGFALECQINGRTERFVIAGNALVGRPGTVTLMDRDVYSVLTDQGRVLLTGDSAQITDGPDAGKWDCVQISVAPAPGGTAPSGDPADLAALQQRLASAQAALEATQEDLIATIGERDAAHAEFSRLDRQLNESLAAVATAQAAQASAEVAAAERETALSEAMTALAAREGELAASIAARRALEVELAEVLAENAALTAGMAVDGMDEEEMRDDEPMPDMTTEEAADADTPMMFDADAALSMLEAADISDISRAALSAAIEQARDNPDMASEVMARLQNALGQ